LKSVEKRGDFGCFLPVTCGKIKQGWDQSTLADFVLNFCTFRGVYILGRIFRNDFTHPIADFGNYKVFDWPR